MIFGGAMCLAYLGLKRVILGRRGDGIQVALRHAEAGLEWSASVTRRKANGYKVDKAEIYAMSEYGDYLTELAIKAKRGEWFEIDKSRVPYQAYFFLGWPLPAPDLCQYCGNENNGKKCENCGATPC